MIIYGVLNYKGEYQGKEYEKQIIVYGDKEHYPRIAALSPADYKRACKERGREDLTGETFEKVTYTKGYGDKLKAVGIV